MAGFSLGIRRSGAGELARRLRRGTAQLQRRQVKALKKAALIAEREIKKGLASGKPGGQRLKPLSPITRLLRRGRKPLVDRGDLLGSIKVTVDENTPAAFVGVHRTSRGAGGTDLVNVALAHEFGTKPFVIPVTDGVRRFFWALHFMSNGAILPLSSTTTRIMHPGVPKRPFLRPAIEAARPKMQGAIKITLLENGGPL